MESLGIKIRQALQVLSVAAGLLASVPLGSAQQAFAPGVCVTGVRNSTLEAARQLVSPGHQLDGRWWASEVLAHNVTMLAGLPKPILYPWFPDTHAWTVSEKNALETFGSRFPSNSLGDRFAVEGGNERIVGVDFRGVYVFDPSSGEFRLLVPARFGNAIGEVANETEFRDVHTVAHIARLGLTLIGTGNGIFQLLGDTVQVLAGAGKAEVGPVFTIIDLPVHKAVLFAGYDSAMLRHDDGAVENLADTSGGMFRDADQIIQAFESRQPGRIVVKGLKTLLEIEMRQNSVGFSPDRSWTLMSSSGNIYPIFLATRSGEFLILDRDDWFGNSKLKRLDANGLHAVPGASVGNLRGLAWMQEITARGLVLIVGGQSGLYAYDGNQVALISGSAPDQIGDNVIATDMPSIGNGVLRTDRGLFGLTADRQLEQIRLPFEYSFVNVELAELPAARLGLIATKDKLFALTQSGLVQPIEGGALDHYSFDAFAGVIPVRNAMLVRGEAGLHLIAGGLPPHSSCPTP